MEGLGAVWRKPRVQLRTSEHGIIRWELGRVDALPAASISVAGLTALASSPATNLLRSESLDPLLCPDGLPVSLSDGSSFTILSEMPCAELSVRRIDARCCGSWGGVIPRLPD